MDSKIKIFETGIEEGIMSRNKKFYSPDLSQGEINQIFKNTRINVGKKYGFNGLHIFQTTQKTDTNKINYEDGTYYEITEKDLKKDDYWDAKINADIIVISSQFKNVVVGHQMADCPVIIIEDRLNEVTAISHCGATYVDRNLPQDTAKVLVDNYNSKPENLYAYIGSCIKKENYIYDKYPTWATNMGLWKDCIEEHEGNYYIDLIKAITKQLQIVGINNIQVSPYDTVTSPKFYSHSSSFRGNKEKFGQNFVGFFYKQ